MKKAKFLSVKRLTSEQLQSIQKRVDALESDPTKEQFQHILAQCGILGLSFQGTGRLRREMSEARTFVKKGAAEPLASKPVDPSSNGHSGLTVETLLPTMANMDREQRGMLAVHLFGENDRLKADLAKQMIDSDNAMEKLRQELMDEREKSKALAALI